MHATRLGGVDGDGCVGREEKVGRLTFAHYMKRLMARDEVG